MYNNSWLLFVYSLASFVCLRYDRDMLEAILLNILDNKPFYMSMASRLTSN